MTPNNVRETVELANQYGISMVLVVVLVIFFITIFFVMLRWVMMMNKEMMTNSHEEKISMSNLLNNGLKNIVDGIHQNTLVCQEIMRSQKDGFDGMSRADGFHRADLDKILKAVQDNECKAEKKAA